MHKDIGKKRRFNSGINVKIFRRLQRHFKKKIFNAAINRKIEKNMKVYF